MSIIDVIKNFPKQFEYEPAIENASRLARLDSFIVCGMGGSHLASGLLKIANPDLDILIHKNYGLPQVSEEKLRNSLLIASSYSGNTEEVIDFFERALEKNLNVAVVSTGGKLIKLAKEHNRPYVQMPATGIQPRSALGFSLRAQMKLMGDEKGLKQTALLAQKLEPVKFEQEGKELAKILQEKIPVIYSSARNEYLTYIWKIKFHEGAKIPAFHNVFPELNHNEMTGYDVIDSTKNLSEKLHFIFLKDPQGNARILKRMQITKELYKERGLRAEVLDLRGDNIWQKIFNSLTLADWAAYYSAQNYGTDPGQVPMVEEFKKLIE